MSTYVKQTSLTVNITENINVNGKSYGNAQTYNFTGNGRVDQRVMEIAAGDNFTQIIDFSTADGKGRFEVNDYTYFRLTNLDDTNFIILELTNASNLRYAVKLKTGESYLLMCPEISAAVEVGSDLVLSDIKSVKAKANTAAVYVEYLVVTKGGVSEGEDGG
tara:strand:- start:8139 stop:8624 length:486 start_codon:yes stop_codon:yes gene_type:complete